MSIQLVKYNVGRGMPANATLGPVGSSFAADAGALFNFDNKRITNTISIENIPDHVNRRELAALFDRLTGEIRSFQDIRDATSARLEITFLDADAAAKALWLNGYVIAGCALSVTPVTTPSTSSRPIKQSKDDRRNLYVLGLPFALTKNEFGGLFSQYGTVVHSVILATVDNSSRRRGFVVMSAHEDAKRAMAALTRTQVKGHTIDVSWAVVQRSQGFLDGGDRAMLLDSRSRLPSPSPKLAVGPALASSDTSGSSLGSHDSGSASLATCSVPTASLLVTNLPTLLFSQAQDLHPLFFPFGHIEKLEIVQVSPLGTMSVVVQYSAAHVAQEAKETLSGQRYGSYQIEARYVKPIAPNHMDLPTSGLVTVDRKTDYTVFTPGDFLGQPRAALDDQAGRCDTGSLAHSSQLGFATGSFFNRKSLATSLPRQSPPPMLPSVFPGNVQDYNSSRLSSIDSRFVYRLFCTFLLPKHLIFCRWSTDERYGLQLHQHQFALPNQMHYNAVYQSSAA
ncbi:hypothetical protein BYT27DRAFT_7160196 [Phlegmacium glaucopus]|nr:hypothetical protein BYT27DRAFT_7160196 [Phlegmacium glaucopus]